MKNLNVFSGQNSIRDFLNPENHLTPLVELNQNLNPFYQDNVHIFIKMQTFMPLMNIKFIPAYQMLCQKKQHKPNLVEASSGNTAFSLSILSKLFGYEKMTAVVSDETSRGKIQMLQLSGAEVVITNTNNSTSEKTIEFAKNIGNKPDWEYLDQYTNCFNPEGHINNCENQLLKQMNNNVQIFCHCLGTTGTFFGTAKTIKKHTNAFCIAITKKKENHIPGPRTLEQLNVTDFDWHEYVDELLEEGTQQAYLQSLNLCRNGLLVGPSSGLNLAGLLKFLYSKKQQNKLDDFRNDDGQINCIILACDLPFPYLEEYFEYLPLSFFPKIVYQD